MAEAARVDLPPGRWRGLAPIIFLAVIMGAAIAASIGMAFNIEAIAKRFGGSNAAYGTLATVELLSIAAGTLAGSRLAGRLGPRNAAFAGMTLAAAANFGGIFTGSIDQLMVFRVLAGLGGGSVIAVVMFMAGRSDRPNVLFGALNSSVGVLGILLSIALPRLIGAYDITGAYGLYAAMAVLALGFIVTLPGRAAPVEGEGDQKAPSLGMRQWPPLVGLGVIFLGHSALAIFIVRIGVGTGVPMTTLGYVFVAVSGLSVVLPVLSGLYGVKVPAALFAGVVLAMLAISANIMANAQDLPMFIIGVALYATLPTAMMPVVLTAFARQDPSGRLAAANPAFVTLGAAVAPIISGRVIDIGGYSLVAWMSTACFLLGALLLAATLFSADRARRAQA
ncbi:MFS transporter [Emcibacter sp. SYSU 3D8]|uniref:MFS transporter n=1 Tax=Emcibacter sp. SYSU 3D8 TaxID=3133969 RepID=UPI0031FEE9D2